MSEARGRRETERASESGNMRWEWGAQEGEWEKLLRETRGPIAMGQKGWSKPPITIASSSSTIKSVCVGGHAGPLRGQRKKLRPHSSSLCVWPTAACRDIWPHTDHSYLQTARRRSAASSEPFPWIVTPSTTLPSFILSLTFFNSYPCHFNFF